MGVGALLIAFIIANLLVLLANVGLLSVFIKLYTEILKIEHVKRIGKE